jgi:hypothetical protein
MLRSLATTALATIVIGLAALASSPTASQEAPGTPGNGNNGRLGGPPHFLIGTWEYRCTTMCVFRTFNGVTTIEDCCGGRVEITIPPRVDATIEN